MKSLQKVKINVHQSAIPTNRAIQQARSIQSAADREAQRKHDLQRRELSAIGVKSFPPDVVLPRITKEIQMADLTMSELAAGGSGFFGEIEKDTTDLTYQGSVSKPSSVQFIPDKDQVYHFIQEDCKDNNSSYWLKWETSMNGVLFCSYNNLNIKKLVLSASTRGLPFVHEIEEISFGRFVDICNAKPSLAQLFQAYKFVQLEPIDLEKLQFDVSHAIPIF